MDSSQSPLHDQHHKDDVITLMPGPMAVKAPPGGLTYDVDDQYILATISPQLIDVTAEETCPAVGMAAQDGVPQLGPAIQTAQAPSVITFELMSKLEALASDPLAALQFAQHAGRKPLHPLSILARATRPV